MITMLINLLMLMKIVMSTLIPKDFTSIELGEVATRARRLLAVVLPQVWASA